VAPSAAPASTPASVLAPVEFAADRIFQRVGTAKTITFNVAYAGAPCAVDIQIVDATSGAIRVPWRTLDNAPAGGLAHGTVSVLQHLGWYKWRVRDHCNAATTYTSANQFGVGALVLLAGQSNLTGQFYFLATNGGVAPGPVPSPYSRRYAGNGWFTTDTPFQPGEIPATFNGNTNGGYGARALANDLVKLLGVNVGLLEYAVGGTYSKEWAPTVQANDPTVGKMYRQMMNPGTVPPHGLTYSDAGSDCELLIFAQGEQDAIYYSANPTLYNGATWTANIGGMLTGIQQATRPNLPMALQLLGRSGGQGYPGHDTGFAAIRTAQLAFIAAHPADAYLSASAMDAGLDISSQLHYNLPFYYRLDYRHAQAYACWLKLVACSATGPVAASAHWSAGVPNQIEVAVVTDAGRTLRDGAAGSGSNLNGFRVFDRGTQLPIIGTWIIGKSVILTIAAPIAAEDVTSGSVTLDYEYGESPHGLSVMPSLANYVFDTATPPGDTIGLPMLPTMTPLTVITP
jgi:hypothetical protein